MSYLKFLLWADNPGLGKVPEPVRDLAGAPLLLYLSKPGTKKGRMSS
jgi:hypothetical protein